MIDARATSYADFLRRKVAVAPSFGFDVAAEEVNQA